MTESDSPPLTVRREDLDAAWRGAGAHQAGGPAGPFDGAPGTGS